MTPQTPAPAAAPGTSASAGLQYRALLEQLGRMREVQGRYFDHFYRLVYFAMAALALMAAASMTNALRSVALLIPFFVIWVGVKSAYYLTYVVFARVYATGIEKAVNQILGGDVLIAHRIEADYLFPLNGEQFAGVPLRAEQTFIGFITIHYWLFGAAAVLLGAYRAWQILPDVERTFPPAGYYFPALIFWALLHLVFLAWYFGTRYHERAAERVVADAYGTGYEGA